MRGQGEESEVTRKYRTKSALSCQALPKEQTLLQSRTQVYRNICQVICASITTPHYYLIIFIYYASFGNKYLSDYKKYLSDYKKYRFDYKKYRSDYKKYRSDHKKYRSDYKKYRSGYNDVTGKHESGAALAGRLPQSHEILRLVTKMRARLCERFDKDFEQLHGQKYRQK